MRSRHGFDPRDLRPELFFDARDLANIGDGNTVEHWPNSGVGTPYFTQSTSAARPVYRARGYNGQPCIEMDGIDDTMALTGDTAAASLLDPCLIVIHDPSDSFRVGDVTAGAQCHYQANSTCGYGDAASAVGMASVKGIGIITAGHGRVLNGLTDEDNLKGTHSDGIFHAAMAIDPLFAGGKLMAILGFLRSPSAPELNAIIEWANDTWGLNVRANMQPWTPLLLDPEAEWDPMFLSEDVAASVASLPDRTANGHDADQATPAKQPVVELHNGRKGLKFDGTDDSFDLASVISMGTGDWTLIAMLADVQNSLVIQEIMATASTEQFSLGTAEQPYTYFRDAAANVRSVSGDSVGVGGDSIIILTMDYSADNELFQDGVSKGTDATVYSAALSSLSCIGRRGGGNDRFLNAVLCYLAVINRALADGERKRLERYLALRGDITL